MQDLSQFINALTVPCALAESSGKIVAHNEAFGTLYPRDDATLIGLDLRDVLPTFAKDTIDTHLEDLTRQTPQTSFVARNGANTVFKTIQADGKQMLLCQSDTSDLEDQLLHFFRDQADQGFWDYDLQTGHFIASEAWRAMRGFDMDAEIIARDMNWLKDVHPQDRERLRDDLQSQMNGVTKTLKTQYRRRHLKTNAWIWIYCRSQVIASGPDGRATRIVGTDTDITEVKLDESKFAQLNNKIELAVDASGIGIFEYDLNTQQVYWDDRLLSMYGLPAGENTRSNTDWGSFVHPDDADDAIAYTEECALTQADVKHDFRVVRPDGEVRHLRTMARYVNLSESETKLIGVNIDVTEDVMRAQELERARAQLEFESQHDALTGLANRRLMNDTINSALTQHDEMCMMHIDLDHFKDINDTLGHAAGDAVLMHVANTLRQILDEALLICRLGGDEFSVLFAPTPSADHVKELGERVIAAFQHPYIFENNACPISVSIGAASGGDKETVYSHADIALYAAKNAGRGRFRSYTDRVGKRAHGRLRRRQDLADAIAANKIECWYQPQFDAATHRLIGAEALARLRPNSDELWAPDAFLPFAEKTGLLPEIEEYMFTRVLADQSKWAKDGLYYPRISVNISKNRLAEKSLVERITKQVEPHHLLSLEILETAFLDSPDVPMQQRLQELRALGFGIELDDFGTGHASVVSMLSLNPDKIKIDKQLTKDIATSQKALAILKALVAIGRAQDVGIVLEGIETNEQLLACEDIDCDVLQGFALSAPIEASEFALLLEERSRHRVGSP